MAEHCPLKRCAVPEDVARVVAFLASDDGSWVNGKRLSGNEISILYTDAIRRPSHHHLWRVISVKAEAKKA